MKQNIATKLAQLSERLLEVNQLLSTEEATRDMDTYRKLNRERAELEPVVELFRAYQACEGDIAAAREMAEDPDMREFAGAEIKEGEARLLQLDSELQKQLLPMDPNFWKCVPAPAATRPPCSPVICSACIRVLPNGVAGRSK